jgi:very-short-patch-repair endonuclease
VFDESSRLPIAHALGALARATSVVIFGYTHQVAPGEAEGLLELAVAAKLPTLSLGAHYRSRHEDLFAFANRRYYNNALEVLPAAQTTAELGIAWRRVDAGADAVASNRAEAEQIVADLRARLADATQRSRTFAIIALTPAQQQLIEETLDSARVFDLALAAAMSADGEYVLVGTPDRIQGEERDIVYVSVGDRATALATLSRTGARRLLDVATTRAREQMTIVSSFAPEDIATDAAPAARDLAELLAFARANGGAAKSTEETAPASPITAAIARALADRGWTLKHQVGCGPYKIDLAVVDPNDPERYVLAIEHDGGAYASSTSARSRDRLRAQLLVSLGWRVHRIWSLDWWLDADREITRAHGAIVAAIAATRSRRTTLQPAPRPARGSIAPRASRTSAGPRLTTPPGVAIATPVTGSDTVPTDAAVLAAGSGPTEAVGLTALPEGSGPITPVRLPRGAIGIGPYTAAAVPAGRRAPDDMFAPRYAGELSKCIEQVLATEAPIHIDLLARRVGAYFGVGRVTPPVLEQIKTALAGRGKFGEEPNIVWRADQDPASVPAVRVAGQGMSARRDIAEVPLSEVAAAARIVVERANGVSTVDLVRDCARLLGFARITEQVSARVAIGVRLASVRELISIDAGKAHLMLE